MTVPEHKLVRFIIIVTIIFLVKVPGCVIVLADDAGQIGYDEYETLIEVSKKTFATPLINITGPADSYGGLISIYGGNVFLLAILVIFIIGGFKYLRAKVKGRN